MKKTLIIFSVAAIPFSGCVKDRVISIKGKSMSISECVYPSTMIIFNGESNSTGRAKNSDTISGEGFVRPNVKILSNANYKFSSLQIGVNNLGGCATCHGWELGLANNVDSGNKLTVIPVYNAKTGVGGTKIKDWDSSAVIYKRLIRIIDSGVSKVKQETGLKPNIALWYSIGINDWIAKTNPDTFKVKLKFLFALLRQRHGNFPIFITKLPQAYSTFNTPILEICSEIEKCYPIETAGLPMQDQYHWNYAAMKIISYRMILKMKEIGGFY